MDFPTAHALLRDRRHWRGALLGVEAGEDGELALARVPAPGDGRPVAIATPLPYTREASGIAAGPCGALFVADTAHDRILYLDGQCGAQAWLPPAPAPWSGVPGSFRRPRGLACASSALLVADSGNARVQGLAFPGLDAHLAWSDWNEPASLAVDPQGRVLAIDAATRTLRRVDAAGRPDAAFDAAVAASNRLSDPLFVACADGGTVLVADVGHDAVIVFDEAGAPLYALPGTPGWQPGALAAHGSRVYVADAASGHIVVFEYDAGTATRIGKVDGWQGPVTALAVDAEGALYIKPGLDARFFRFAADGAYLPRGSLEAGPFDAGEDREWERAFADTVLPAGTSVEVEVATAGSDATPPGPADWIRLPAPDALLANVTQPGRRFAWLRLTLASGDGGASPQVRQARLATAGEDYLDYLPLTYRYNDLGAGGFLSRWLRLMRSEFGRIEELLDDAPRLADPRFGTGEALEWLAQWFGFELPQIADEAARRALVARAVGLMARRGTAQSIAEFVELHTGIAPTIVEGFADRRIWMLGHGSLLDFGTRLAPLDPLGMVVPDPARETGCCPAVAPPADTSPRSACATAAPGAVLAAPVTAIGRAVVGESGPLAQHQSGLPLFAEEAYRFCVVIDAYRAADPQTVQEIARIVEREKPAHTDWRLALLAPELRVGSQARIGIDAIVGGEPPAALLDGSQLSVTAHLAAPGVPRAGEAALDGSFTLT